MTMAIPDNGLTQYDRLSQKQLTAELLVTRSDRLGAWTLWNTNTLKAKLKWLWKT